MTLNPNDFYEVEINETNIDRYNMAERFNQSREELLSRAAEATEQGFAVSAKIPRAEVDKFNVFDTFGTDEVIDPARIKHCGYEKRELEGGGEVYVCLVHGKTSEYNVEKRPHAPCIQVDPDLKPTKEQMDTVLGCRYETKQDPFQGTIQVCIIHDQQSKHDVTRIPNMPCLEIDPR
jgi:hypothetical protein